MSEVIVRMEMPKVCITKGGYYGNCPMDRVWCIQRNAPSEMVMKDAYAEMTESIPSWCPIVGVLPEQHGRLGDLDSLAKMVNCARIEAMQEGSDTNPYWLLGDIIAQAKTIIPATERNET